jgi:subtilase family serine protease
LNQLKFIAISICGGVKLFSYELDLADTIMRFVLTEGETMKSGAYGSNIFASTLATIAAAILVSTSCIPATAAQQVSETVTVVPPFSQTGTRNSSLITQKIDESTLVTLKGNTHPAMQPANDLGAVSDSLQLDHMYLLLKRSPEQQQKVDSLIDQLHDSKSALYHQWLTADQIAEQFGPSEQDVGSVTKWLEAHGFTVNTVYRANGVIDFSGPAGSVRKAFHTEIHDLSVKGRNHIANASDPKIPSSLAPVIHGVVSMNDFRPHRATHPRAQYSFNLDGVPYLALVPGDLWTIYNLNPLYSAGISGQGQTILVVEDTNVFSSADWTKFRTTFGLAKKFPHGSFTQIHPQPSRSSNSGGACRNPGVNSDGDDIEAELDMEWASAAAPNAAIVNASCANTNTNFGGFIALQNLLAVSGSAPAVISISYIDSETDEGTTGNAYINKLYETAVLQGISVFVAAGDAGADATDFIASADIAVTGISVNGMASTPHNVAVGGTDFADTYYNKSATYWSRSNGTYFNSALSYIPEIPWNDSCASKLISNYLGYSTTYGIGGLCNSDAARSGLLNIVAGGGGPSGCASGSPSVGWDDSGYLYGVVSGTCRGYSKPSYQYLVPGNPRDGVRDLPDVSLFAADGIWNHYYVICYSNPAYSYGAQCVGPPMDWTGAGGTSFASPILAGIQAMVNQATGERQGNPNFVYYALAATEYATNGGAACNSSLGKNIGSNCIFHDVTLGDNDIPCSPITDGGWTVGTFNCYQPSGDYGVLSQSNSSYKVAYPTARGWDFATGLGSVNAYNLVKNWPGAQLR